MYDVVVKKVHVRYLISWWVSCTFLYLFNWFLSQINLIRFDWINFVAHAVSTKLLSVEPCYCWTTQSPSQSDHRSISKRTARKETAKCYWQSIIREIVIRRLEHNAVKQTGRGLVYRRIYCNNDHRILIGGWDIAAHGHANTKLENWSRNSRELLARRRAASSCNAVAVDYGPVERYISETAQDRS